MAEGGVASNGQKRTPMPQPGLILYPALGNPELVSGDDALHLLVCLSAAPAEMKGDAGKHVVAEHLKFLSLGDTERFKLRSLGAEGLHGPLDASLIKSVESLAGFASSATPVFKNEEKRFYGIFRSTVLKYFTGGTLHEYNDARIKKTKPENPYHIAIDGPKLRAWIKKNLDPGLMEHCFANWATKPEDEGFRELEEEAVTNGLRKTLIEGETKFVGPRLRAAHDAFLKEQGEAITGEDGPLRVFDIFNWKFQAPRPLATLHPVFFYPKDRNLNIGFISDLHVVSRLEVLSRSDFQLVPGADTAHSPRIGGMLSTPGRAVKDLLSKAGMKIGAGTTDGEVDVVVMGGDLIDFAMGCFPGASLPASLQADKARDMVNGDDATVPSKYDYGIDYMAIYDLVVRFYRESGKPVVILAGNHDAYDRPFGISPRAIRKTKLGNPGIPMDANLTVMEACLLYGDRYDYYAHIENFQPAVMDCFYLLFTPVFSFTAKMGRMQWISLGWGDEEDMFWDGPGLIPGHLPNAQLAVSNAELPLIDYGVDHAGKAGAKCAMFSHYTWACYSEPVLQDGVTSRSFPTGNQDDTTDYNLGTCENNRLHVYKHMFNGGIQYAVSGHAHRSGIYTMNAVTPVAELVYVLGHPIERFQEASAKHKPPYMIVSDSAGPIPRENVLGEFNGQGSNRPSFTKLTFDEYGDLVGLRRVPSTLPATLPRMAVTMDYCEIEANGLIAESGFGVDFWLKEITAKSGINPAAVKAKTRQRDPYISLKSLSTGLKHVPDWVGIQSMVLYLKEFDSVFTGFPILYVAGYGWAVQDDQQLLLQRKSKLDTSGLLSITLGIFPGKANGSTYMRYDFTKPWVVAADVVVTPASSGFFADSDMEISIERSWDYVKYATQSKYRKLLPSGKTGGGSGAGSSADKQGAKSPAPSTGSDAPGTKPMGNGMFQLPWTF